MAEWRPLAAMTVPLACGGIFYAGEGVAPSPCNPGLIARLEGRLQAPMLFFWGGLDGHITPEHVKMVTDAMRAANKTFVNVGFSGDDHDFFCNERRQLQRQRRFRSMAALTLAYLKNHAG